jgi:hypothetical protein
VCVCSGACTVVRAAILTLVSVQLKEKYVHAGCTRHAAHTAYESLIRSQANAIRFPEAFKVSLPFFFSAFFSPSSVQCSAHQRLSPTQTLAEMHKEGLRLRSHASRALVEAMSRDCRVIDDVSHLPPHMTRTRHDTHTTRCLNTRVGFPKRRSTSMSSSCNLPRTWKWIPM